MIVSVNTLLFFLLNYSFLILVNSPISTNQNSLDHKTSIIKIESTYFDEEIKMKKWSEKENIILVYLVDNLAKKWTEIYSDYKIHFNNRTLQSIRKQYFRLSSSGRTADLKNKYDLIIKDIEIVENQNLISDSNNRVETEHMS
jgi:hypothetical protein